MRWIIEGNGTRTRLGETKQGIWTLLQQTVQQANITDVQLRETANRWNREGRPRRPPWTPPHRRNGIWRIHEIAPDPPQTAPAALMLVPFHPLGNQTAIQPAVEQAAATSVGTNSWICMDQFDPNEDFWQVATASRTCQHAPITCRNCMTRSMNSQIGSKHWGDITCPSCNSKLNPQEIQAYAAPDDFQKYVI